MSEYLRVIATQQDVSDASQGELVLNQHPHLLGSRLVRDYAG